MPDCIIFVRLFVRSCGNHDDLLWLKKIKYVKFQIVKSNRVVVNLACQAIY